jgi:hypothetical protein
MTSDKVGVFQSMLNILKGESQTDSLDNQLINYVVATVDPKLKLVRGYQKRLEEPLRKCREHCRALVAQIPGPIYIKRPGYSDDPMIKAAFAGSDRVEELLVRSNDPADTAECAGSERFALLTMASRETTIFGSKRQGNMIVGDAAMRAITFSDHNLVGLATSLADSHEALEKYCLEIIAEAAARHLSEIRTKLVDLRERRERLRAMNKMFGGGTGAGMGCLFVPFDPEKQMKQKQLEQMLVENESKIAAARNKCETPEDWLIIIRDFLSRPEDILSIQPVSLRLNWCNVLTDDLEEKADTISFATFTLSDEMQREGILVAYEQQ